VREQLDPKEAPTMLATNLKKWEQQLIKQGIQQGLQQGLQQGIVKGKLETARKLKQKGLSIQEIAEITGLSIEEVEQL
jgi:predicted transposase/invertase (TIGR01784 family)